MKDEARTNRRTTFSAVAWTSALLVAVASGGTLVVDAASHRFLARGAVIVLALTTLLAILGLSLLWELRPTRSWSLSQLLLWLSVAMVWVSLAASWFVPWYFHWLAGFATA
ncbi:MAG: hypothetical protein K6U87_01005 [Firmicutes bacterium]|nr:hypothetical protein [Bacillota bacterium]